MGEYSAKKTAWKGLKIFIFGGIGAIVAYLTALPPEQQVPIVVLITGLLVALNNYLKHYND